MVGRVLTAVVGEIEVYLLALVIVGDRCDLVVVSLLEGGIRLIPQARTMLGDVLDPSGIGDVHAGDHSLRGVGDLELGITEEIGDTIVLGVSYPVADDTVVLISQLTVGRSRVVGVGVSAPRSPLLHIGIGKAVATTIESRGLYILCLLWVTCPVAFAGECEVVEGS